MEFVRLKYANNKLINANLKEHREIITEYVEKKGYSYLGFVPLLLGSGGKTLEIDLIFQAPKTPKQEARREKVSQEPRLEAKHRLKREVKREASPEPKHELMPTDLFLDDQQAITAELLGLDDEV